MERFFPRIGGCRGKKKETEKEDESETSPENVPDSTSEVVFGPPREFTFLELTAATNHFPGDDRFLGKDGFSRVHKGLLEDTNQLVAVKERQAIYGAPLLDLEIFMKEVEAMSNHHHPNIVNLIGYCHERDERLLVYKFMPLGSLKDILFDNSMKPIGWRIRMNIAIGVAEGLTYLHDEAKVVHGNVKSSNVLLGENYHPRLSDIGLRHISKMVHSATGYFAPEIVMGIDQLTRNSDVYSFGVLLLEIITGRKAFDITRPYHKRFLVDWAKPLLRNHMYMDLIHPDLTVKGIPDEKLRRAINMARECVLGQPRPMMYYVLHILKV